MTPLLSRETSCQSLVVRGHEQPDLIEVVYYRYHSAYLYEAGSVADALRFIEAGQDAGDMWTLGVYVNGEPHIYGGYVSQNPPTPEEAQAMRDGYREAARG